MNSSKIKKYVGLIESSNVYDVAQITPVTKANQLSKLLKNEVLLKREDLQPIFSFKIRGAYNKLSKLKQKGIKGPIIAASAGNHAQGVAFGAKSLGLKAYIVMPITTASIKVNAVKNCGGKVILNGDNIVKTTKAPIHACKAIKRIRNVDSKIKRNFRVKIVLIKSAKQNNPPITPNNLLIYSVHVLKALKSSLSYPR